MSDVLVLTRSSDRAQSAPFERTAERHKLRLHILDGREPNSDVSGYLAGIAAVSNTDAKWIVLTDAFDVLVSHWDENELIGRLEYSRGNLLMSCEQGCWPDGEWCALYPEAKRPWKYICGGQYAGKRGEMLALMREIYERRDTVTAGGSSQEILHKLFIGGWPMSLDQNCSIFQSMLGTATDQIAFKDGRAYNSLTKTEPMLLHFNGGALGLKEWRERLCA